MIYFCKALIYVVKPVNTGNFVRVIIKPYRAIERNFFSLKCTRFSYVPKACRHGAVCQIPYFFRFLPSSEINVKEPPVAKICKEGRVYQLLNF
jgi:hypothetical protein